MGNNHSEENLSAGGAGGAGTARAPVRAQRPLFNVRLHLLGGDSLSRPGWLSAPET